MPIFFALQPLRGVIALDRLTLYDHGGITAFDTARGRGDGAGDVACCQHHRETYRQGGEQCQEDLFYVLFHCAEFLVFLFCTDLTDFTDIFARTRIFTEFHGISVHLHPCNPSYPYNSLICLRVVPCFSVFVICPVRISRILRIFLLEHGISRNFTESLFNCIRIIRAIRTEPSEPPFSRQSRRHRCARGTGRRSCNRCPFEH